MAGNLGTSWGPGTRVKFPCAGPPHRKAALLLLNLFHRHLLLPAHRPDPNPSAFNSLQGLLSIPSPLRGGDTDTIATMAGAIAGAYYGMEQVPESWQRSAVKAMGN